MTATLSHGLTKDCPTPTPSGACPGHPFPVDEAETGQDLRRRIILLEEQKVALVRAVTLARDTFRGLAHEQIRPPAMEAVLIAEDLMVIALRGAALSDDVAHLRRVLEGQS